MRTRGYPRYTPWQHSSAGPGGLWLMQTAPTGGYGEHMPGWDMQHPLIRQSISCPRAPAQLCWLLQEVAEPSLVLSLPLEARPAVPLLSARPRPWARAARGSCSRTGIATCNSTALHGTSPGLGMGSWVWGCQDSLHPLHRWANRLLLCQKDKAQTLNIPLCPHKEG